MSEKYYNYYESPIGILRIETSKDTVLAVNFVDKMDQDIERNDFSKEVVKQLDEYFKGQRKLFEVKVEFNGTDFQKKAWETLLQIPYGETISYKEQGIKMGKEKAVRAIGGANGKNNIAIIVPCHRVIGSNL